ncbi:SlyX protein [Pseudolabrys taiwanensis]|uniref:Protein SlyX homolog n=1 Tax=Pseudolabrys taiwanensis TaxID=331696 RepID=A0A345ZVN1_9HYPH|nr:SlyX family protein [Pseudolabrys taiwanensis]AXK80978.1 SlyX protein [Pseudolabrys taiwanensis]
MPDLQPDIATLMRRIEALEMDAAHRGRMIEDLNATIMAQWKEIDGLKRQLRQLTEQLAELEAPRDGAPEPPPPHY